ncbi:hypothetical protein Hanom_Chr09g00798231 [Helianthus anomalus]
MSHAMLLANAILLAVCSLIAIAILERAALNDRLLYSDYFMCLCTMSSFGSFHSCAARRKYDDKRIASLVTN